MPPIRPRPLSRAVPLLLLALLLPQLAQAYDYPTTGRVEYVLECMSQHPGKQEYLYKCACVIDTIAQALPYDDYVEIATALRHQGMGGQRGAAFRDPPAIKAMANTYKSLQQSARQACYVQ